VIRFRKHEHEHTYLPVAVEHRVKQPSILLPAASASTIILWRCDCCDCGAVYSQEITGRWSLAQIRGETDTTREDLDEQMDAIKAGREEAAP
jgi:hypothetical protein